VLCDIGEVRRYMQKENRRPSKSEDQRFLAWSTFGLPIDLRLAKKAAAKDDVTGPARSSVSEKTAPE
jgi:hypothetical protein